jgi:hypothetical protein
VHLLKSSNTVISKYTSVRQKVRKKSFGRAKPAVLSAQFSKEIQTQQCHYKTIPFSLFSLHVSVMMNFIRPSVYIIVQRKIKVSTRDVTLKQHVKEGKIVNRKHVIWI